jgi:hypothetical protein
MQTQDIDDDEPTIIDVRPSDLDAMPALPLPLRRARARGAIRDDRWLDALTPETRDVLERARRLAGSWPRAPRIDGAVAVPLQKIPSLRPH